MICVGIDVAKDKHDCFILSSEGEILADVFTIQNNAEGFDTLLQTIRRCTRPTDKIKVGLEATGHYSYNILGFLIAKGLDTYVINPLHTNLYRKSLSLRKTKTDRVDARTIAAMLMSDVDLKSYTDTAYHNEELMVFDLQQVDDFLARFLRQIAAHLHIDPLVPSHSHEVYLLGGVFANIHIIALPPKLEVHDVFQHSGNGLRVEAHHAVFERSIRKVEFPLRFQDGFALHIIPLAAVDHESLFLPFQIIIDCFHREGAPFTLHKFHDGIGRKGFADILHNVLHHTVEQVKVRDIVSPGDVARDDGMVDPLDNLVGRTLVEVPKRNDGKTAHADILVQKFFRCAATIADCRRTQIGYMRCSSAPISTCWHVQDGLSKNLRSPDKGVLCPFGPLGADYRESESRKGCFHEQIYQL